MTLKSAIQLKQTHSQRDRNQQMDKIMREVAAADKGAHSG